MLAAMTKHYMIGLDGDELAKAEVAAEARGLAMEDYLKSLISAHLPNEAPESRQKLLLAKIIGIGSTEHPTDIAKDKDKLIGEAVWEEHLRETKQE
jgi:hypothetical protein